MSFEHARQIADAVLLGGYALDPYRAPAPKNRFRTPFGVLAPRDWSERSGCEPWWLQTQCLVEAASHLRLDMRLRFLHDRRGGVERLDDGDLHEVDYGGIAVTEHMELELPFAVGDAAGRTRQRRHALRGVLRVCADPLDAERPLVRLRVRVENTTPWVDAEASRDVVLPACMHATHLLLGVSDGSFL